MFKKVDRVFISEVFALSVIITIALSSVIMMARLLTFGSFLFATPNLMQTLMMIIVYLFPIVLKFLLPIAVLIATALVSSRMSHDRELEALMSSGMTTLRYLVSPIYLGIGLVAIIFFSSIYLEPYTNSQFEKYKWIEARNIAESFFKSTLRENSFTENSETSDLGNFTLFIKKMDSQKEAFEDVFLYLSKDEQSSANVVVSKTGALKEMKDQALSDYIFSLNDGVFYSSNYNYNENDKKTLNDWSMTHFSQMNLSFVSLFSEKFGSESFSYDESSLHPKDFFLKLIDHIQNDPHWRDDQVLVDNILNFFRKIALSFSAFFLPILGACIGITDPRRKQVGVYLGIGLGVFFFYSSLSICRVLVAENLMHPYGFFILPSVVLLMVTFVYVYWRSQFPPSTGFVSFLALIIGKLRSNKS